MIIMKNKDLMQKIYHNLNIKNMSKVEEYIQILESRISDERKKFSKMTKADHDQEIGMVIGNILGFESALRIYKSLNDR